MNARRFTYRTMLAAAVLAVTISGCTSTDPTPPAPAPTWLQSTTSQPTATLPPSMIATTIDAMEVGDYGYTVPWAMWVDMNNHMWLNPRYPVGSKGGTQNMRVERRSDGFHVWPPAGEEYIPTDEPGYYGQGDSEWIRVVAIEGVR